MKSGIAVFTVLTLLLLPSIALAEEMKETSKTGTVGNTIVLTKTDARGRILQLSVDSINLGAYHVFQPQASGNAYHNGVPGVWTNFRSESSYKAAVSYNKELMAYLEKQHNDQLNYDPNAWLKQTGASLEYWAKKMPKCNDQSAYDNAQNQCPDVATPVGP